ncbi:SDR family NAD(P)-dependent oxidoreductase [Pseudonocardia spinosispora]|uniref:SDR family NAD(P)-dependent oxidoreductase n=1 Tax=Pseudonocardia spinosispora TaxID=103441 RepID=UPI00041A0459|nr:SDR family NAD(P)-dependent oxidoreductase [Pseudonocardia spinosispora]
MNQQAVTLNERILVSTLRGTEPEPATPRDTGAPAGAVAAVTGAAGGIGAAIAARLTADGYAVALLDISDAVHLTRDDIGAPLSARLDVTDREDVQHVLAEVIKATGRLDVLVNCAGTAHRSSFADTSAQEFLRDINTNLLGTFLTCQAAVFPHMRAAGRGRLINIASVSGKTGGIGSVHADGSGGRSGAGYASAKAGVINLTRWIAREVGHLGITSNAVAPGPIATAMTDGHHYDTANIPIGRLGTPEEVADAVSWLAGRGAGYVNGIVLDVDGGLTRA